MNKNPNQHSRLPCDHDEEGVCPGCGLVVDAYGNTEDDFRNCCFPDCGCDGARNCMAENGPSSGAYTLNIERGSLKKHGSKA